MIDRCYVYKITCLITEKIYIGISNDPRRRFNSHVSAAKTGMKSCSKLAGAIRKYGRDQFELIILLCGNRSYCAEMEIKLIAEWRTIEFGYNIRPGGETAEPPIECGPKRFELYDKFLDEVRKGIHPREMDWLPISHGRALEILRDESIPLPRCQKEKPPLIRPRTFKNGTYTDQDYIDICKAFESGIHRDELMVQYALSKQQLYTASARGKSIIAKRNGAKYYLKGML